MFPFYAQPRDTAEPIRRVIYGDTYKQDGEFFRVGLIAGNIVSYPIKQHGPDPVITLSGAPIFDAALDDWIDSGAAAHEATGE